MENHSITFSESRVLPALIVGVIVLMASFILVSADVSIGTRMLLVGGLALAVMWPVRRILYPRWVLRITESKLYYRDLSSKEVIEIDKATVSKVSVRRKAQFDASTEGVGFQNYLVLQTNCKTWELQLPVMSVKSKTITEAISKGQF
jgi:hypothetical protein